MIAHLSEFMAMWTPAASGGSALMAVRYALGRWEALLRYCDDGRIEIDNNAAERSLRAVVLGRENYLFNGSDAGGARRGYLQPHQFSQTQRFKPGGLSEERAGAHRRSPYQPHRGTLALERRPKLDRDPTPRRLMLRLKAISLPISPTTFLKSFFRDKALIAPIAVEAVDELL
jgi:hypothetical protein